MSVQDCHFSAACVGGYDAKRDSRLPDIFCVSCDICRFDYSGSRTNIDGNSATSTAADHIAN